MRLKTLLDLDIVTLENPYSRLLTVYNVNCFVLRILNISNKSSFTSQSIMDTRKNTGGARLEVAMATYEESRTVIYCNMQ